MMHSGLTVGLRLRTRLACALLLSVSLVGCRSSAPPEEETHAAPVHAEPAKKVVVGEWTELLGTTQPLPNRSARISAAVEGHVLSVLGDGTGSAVVEGQQVKPEQIVVQLDDRVVRANRDKLRATLKDLDEQQKQAGFALELATIDVRRLEDLQQNKSSNASVPLVSRVELEKARITQKDAESKQKSATAKRDAAMADLKGLDRQLDFFALKSPIAGRLGIVQAVPGQTLTPGTVVADVVDLSEIDVLSYAPPATAAKLALDQPARLVLGENADLSKPLQGKVVFIGVQALPETGNVAVKIRFANPDFGMRANSIVHVNVLTQPERERLTIPEAVLSEDRDVPTVVVVEDVKTEKKGEEETKLGKARRLEAKIGVRDREHHVVELIALEDPEKKKEKVSPDGLLFVTEGGQGLKNDDKVKVEEAHEEKPHEDK
jgi:RND family efflux transporter MFP subunit